MDERQWYYSRSAQQYGPVTLAELQRLLSTHAIDESDLVWADGMAEWQLARNVPELKPDSQHSPDPARPMAPPPIAPHPIAYYGPIPSRGPGASSNGLALAGFVLSLTVPVVGFILSLVALSQMKKSGNDEGRGFAVAGAVIGGIFVGFIAVVFLCMCGGFFSTFHRFPGGMLR